LREKRRKVSLSTIQKWPFLFKFKHKYTEEMVIWFAALKTTWPLGEKLTVELKTRRHLYIGVSRITGDTGFNF
jgi:hypothetical protein